MPHPTISARRIRAVLIAGATASGKSAFALALAAHLPAVIVNADALQVYGDLAVLTARPTAEEMARVPHRLYGHVAGQERYNVARWLAEAERVLAEAKAEGRWPLIVGGTGLYFKALIEGLAAVPPIPADLRAATIADYERLGAEAFRARLLERDPGAAAIGGADRARLIRAYEVVAATGRPLAAWIADGQAPRLEATATLRLVLDPPRRLLHARVAERFDAMLARGAIEEVRRLVALGLAPAQPVMKAVGVPELARHLAGTMSLAEARERAIARTRQYVKRQATWFRHQMPDWERLAPQDHDRDALQFASMLLKSD